MARRLRSNHVTEVPLFRAAITFFFLFKINKTFLTHEPPKALARTLVAQARGRRRGEEPRSGQPRERGEPEAAGNLGEDGGLGAQPVVSAPGRWENQRHDADRNSNASK